MGLPEMIGAPGSNYQRWWEGFANGKVSRRARGFRRDRDSRGRLSHFSSASAKICGRPPDETTPGQPAPAYSTMAIEGFEPLPGPVPEPVPGFFATDVS